MKLVLADDFTGAAELAGIGFRCGFQVEVRRDLDFSSRPQLLVMDVDSRSRTQNDVSRRMRQVVTAIRPLPLDFLYKKTDSVLRGHVRLELEHLLEGLDYRLILLLPANPSRGRVIRNGVYYLQGKPLHETDLGIGRRHPVQSAYVLDLIGQEGKAPLVLKSPEEPLPPEGIVIGEVASREDLKKWTKALGPAVLPAGGSEFFEVILESRRCRPRGVPYPEEVDFRHRKMLFLLGSRSGYSQQFLQQLRCMPYPICLFPGDLSDLSTFSEETLQRWFTSIVDAFNASRRVIVAIGQSPVKNRNVPSLLAGFTARLVEKLFHQVQIDELVIEGGATAAAVLNRLHWNRFTPVQELTLGVVRLKIADKETPYLTVKPGSYSWPSCLWE
ncbi:MAG: hypothetical protein D6681_04810 [Calditrichaeota bacterium]|nr:MAG: hypothetical protein D6681_04810 [Calditrichota bacterium]